MTPQQKKDLYNIRFELMKQSPVCFIQFSDFVTFQVSLKQLPMHGIEALKRYYDFVVSNGIADENLKELDRARLVDEEIVKRQSIPISSMFNINYN